ncbi:hypothetical protein DPM19_09480 [Actinomadura craniellae]|uniref:Uncharacterized protein n=1 Tax=Actinomadura craniellae TaxID=2231787 RepID=A0A365HA46_9ACTN|nr:hypothetical protein [Actinomadura craniellae]RAY15967.1 hypothetical protein DPM19_09480 [Actinomadura craniellae]
MSGTSPDIWIATSDGRDMIRADAITVVRFDGGGRVTAQLHDEARVSVTLVDGSVGTHPPDDFHRRLIRVLTELTDTGDAHLVTPVCAADGWHWTTEPL